MTYHRTSSDASYPIDILTAKLGAWSTLGKMCFSAAALVTGDRSFEGLMAAVKNVDSSSAAAVELPKGEYAIQLRSIAFGSIKRVASIRVLGLRSAQPRFGKNIGMTSIRFVGELFIFDLTELTAASDLIDESRHFDEFFFGLDDCECVTTELTAADTRIDLPVAYARVGFDADGTAPICELRDADGRIGFQIDFLTIGDETYEHAHIEPPVEVLEDHKSSSRIL